MNEGNVDPIIQESRHNERLGLGFKRRWFDAPLSAFLRLRRMATSPPDLALTVEEEQVSVHLYDYASGHTVLILEEWAVVG